MSIPTLIGAAPAAPQDTSAPKAATPPAEGPKNPAATEAPAKQEQKAQEGTKPDATEGQAKADAAPPAIEVQLPDGVEANPSLVEALKVAAKDSKSAQALVDAYVGALKAADEKARVDWEQKQTAWVEEVRADKELGGGNFDASVRAANKAIERFGSAELRQFLEETGLGNHPQLVRFAARIGRAFAEDSVAGTSATKPTDAEDPLRKLYPSHFKE